jgi:hypothetical protein
MDSFVILLSFAEQFFNMSRIFGHGISEEGKGRSEFNARLLAYFATQ